MKKYKYRWYFGFFSAIIEASGNFSIILFSVARSLVDFIEALTLFSSKLRSILDRLWQKKEVRNDNYYDYALRVSKQKNGGIHLK